MILVLVSLSVINPEDNLVGMLKEFKEFAVKGNVVDMAVGIIIGAAYWKYRLVIRG